MKYVFLIGIMLLSSSCATILRGSKQLVSIVTYPAGAIVKYKNQIFKTPASIDLERKHEHVMTISKPGYETQEVRVVPKSTGASAAQIILPGGLIAFGIDKATGADCELHPVKVDLMLKKIPVWKMFWMNPQKGYKKIGTCES